MGIKFAQRPRDLASLDAKCAAPAAQGRWALKNADAPVLWLAAAKLLQGSPSFAYNAANKKRILSEMSYSKTIALAIAALSAAASMTAHAEEAKPSRAPAIKHQPVTIAVQGQSIAIRATVTGESEIKAVTLNYTTSKDVAPFKLQMQSAGAGIFVTSIPANLLSRASQVTYYIDAIDERGLSAETPWHTVTIQAPQAGSGKAAAAGGAEKTESSWKKPAVIAGGILLVGGATAAIVASSSKKSSDSSSTTVQDYSGTYVGSVSVSLEIPGQPTDSSSHGMTISVGTDGTVSSDTLYEGQHLQSSLSGANFSLSANVSETNLNGSIDYSGSIVGDRITGSVGGTAETSSGTNGVYYGTFYAVKQ